MTQADQHTTADAARLAAIVENLADAVVGTDGERIITDWNPAAERLFGHRQQEVVGRYAGLVVPPALREQSERVWREVQRGPDGFVRMETERMRHDGTIIDVELTMVRVDDPDASLACWATYRDISARKRHERELAAHASRLKALAIAEARSVATLVRASARREQEQPLSGADAHVRAEHAALSALLAALDARDQYTGSHSQAVVELARSLAETLGLPAEEVETVAQVALLHDLGKVGIPDTILQKPGPLTELEWELMRQHPAIGARIVAMIEPLAHLAPAIHAEHERWDGGGYPDGLAGEEIPVAARITLACDAYHAMISDRPYREALGRERAIAELRDHAGTQFDPAVVRALLAALGT